MVTPAVTYGIVAALMVVAVATCFRIRMVKNSSTGQVWTLTALCLSAGVLVGSATVLLAHYGSYTAVIHAGQVRAVRPSWLPSLPIAIGVGFIVGAVSARVLQSAGVRLVRRATYRQLISERSAT